MSLERIGENGMSIVDCDVMYMKGRSWERRRVYTIAELRIVEGMKDRNESG